MLKIGEINRLKINRFVDFGAYLDSGDGREILIPAKYIDPDLAPGDEIDVFVYTDSQDRLIATTEHPKAMVGEFAFLPVVQVNSVGAFLDWGITAKDLLVPFSEQKMRLNQGGVYLVYVYLDDTTKRIVATTRIERYLGNVLPRYKHGQHAKALIIERHPLGYRCIVDNLHYGMLYQSEQYSPLSVGDLVDVYVKNVRDDGKIDLTLKGRADVRTSDLGSVIIDRLRSAGGVLHISDKSSPEEIQRQFSCSKRDFKKAIGHLYKDKKIVIEPSCIRLAP